MTSGEGFADNPDLPIDFKVQRELLREAEALMTCIRYQQAAELIVDASVYRDQLSSISTVDETLKVRSATEYNETLHAFLERLVGAGYTNDAEGFATKRLRTSADAYEVSGLHYWAAMHEAQAGNFAIAEAEAVASEEVAESIGSPWLAAQSENLLSRMHDDVGNGEKAKQYLIKALDNIERGNQSDLYLPENYKQNAMYGVKHRLRFFLGTRLFWDREREARDFCNEVLTTSPDPSRRGFLHHWMGQAEMLHTKPIGKSGTYRDVTQAAIHLKTAEDLFVEAGEPVYAGFVVLDQGELGELDKALERGEKHVHAAISQYEVTESSGLAMEVDSLVHQFKEARLRTFITRN